MIVIPRVSGTVVLKFQLSFGSDTIIKKKHKKTQQFLDNLVIVKSNPSKHSRCATWEESFFLGIATASKESQRIAPKNGNIQNASVIRRLPRFLFYIHIRKPIMDWTSPSYYLLTRMTTFTNFWKQLYALPSPCESGGWVITNWSEWCERLPVQSDPLAFLLETVSLSLSRFLKCILLWLCFSSTFGRPGAK